MIKQSILQEYPFFTMGNQSEPSLLPCLADRVSYRADMTFDHGYSMKDSSEARARAESLLSKLCHVTMAGIQPEVPRVFSQLVGAVQKLARPDIRALYDQLKRGQICSMNNDRTK